jgi:hypothetical protein
VPFAKSKRLALKCCAGNAKSGRVVSSAVDKFAAQAGVLQERLLARAHSTEWKESSLQHWWNTTGFVNPCLSSSMSVSLFQFSNDATAETEDRSAAMLTAVADYRHATATDVVGWSGDNKTASLVQRTSTC